MLEWLGDLVVRGLMLAVAAVYVGYLVTLLAIVFIGP